MKNSFRSSGFSLVEVLIALGVTSFALISLIGVIPIGLQSVRDSLDETAKVSITQNILSNVQRTSWSELQDLHNQKSYFNDEGNPVTADKAIYEVTTLISGSVVSSGNIEHSQARSLVMDIVAVRSKRSFRITTLMANNGTP